jgi:hypothetical protein
MKVATSCMQICEQRPIVFYPLHDKVLHAIGPLDLPVNRHQLAIDERPPLFPGRAFPHDGIDHAMLIPQGSQR